jgi:cytoskeletal protein CcmA (bactofilin family)
MNNRDNLRQAAKDFFGLEGTGEEGSAVTAPSPRYSVSPEIGGESGEMVVLEPRKQTSVIAEGTTITGRLRSSGHVEILGKMDGNVEADGDVTISGKVSGNIKGDQLRMLNCNVKGNLEADSRVVINNESVIIGDLNADSLVLDGKLKGNINVSKTAVFNSNSYLMGDITTSTISVDAGAVINGMVKTFVDYDAESPFEKL